MALVFTGFLPVQYGGDYRRHCLRWCAQIEDGLADGLRLCYGNPVVRDVQQVRIPSEQRIAPGTQSTSEMDGIIGLQLVRTAEAMRRFCDCPIHVDDLKESIVNRAGIAGGSNR